MKILTSRIQQFDRLKKTSIFMLLVFSVYATSFAQSAITEDFLVLNSGDTLHGSVEYINSKRVSPEFYKKIRVTDENGKRRQFKQKDVSAFKADGKVFESYWLSQSSDKITLVNPKYDIDPENGAQYFLRLIRKGELSHYQWEWWEQGESTLMWMDLLRKKEDQFFIRATQGLLGLKKKVLTDYFMNCPDLKERIEKKELDEVWQLVDFYNNNCEY
ncbi:hypothetical protein [Fulvivirga sp.]|uniref:hypothetical protein n=1 Tax=Fulvivirga sp. TaxID=1931237 RepID=UPI0032EC7F0D